MVVNEGTNGRTSWKEEVDIDKLLNPFGALMYKQFEAKLKRAYPGANPDYGVVMGQKKMPFFFITEAQVIEGLKNRKL